MRFLDHSNCLFVKPELAKFLSENTVYTAVFTVRDEEHIVRHALVLYGPGGEPFLATSETEYFTSGYNGAGTRTLLTTIYLLLAFDVKVRYVQLDDGRPFLPYDDATKNERFLRTLGKEARPLILSISTLGDEADEESAYCVFDFERGSLMVKR